MRATAILMLAALSLGQALQAHLEISQPATDPIVFSGKERQIDIVFHNTGDDDFDGPISVRIFQASSSTLAPIGPRMEWKKLRVLAGQKVIENASFDFPDIRTMTVFQVEWSDSDRTQLGSSTVRVVPRNLLAQISVLASNTTVGLIDPNDVFKPLLKECGVKFEELAAKNPFADFDGRLVLIDASADFDIVSSGIKAGTKHPLTIVWLRDFTEHITALPNMYFVEAGLARISIVDALLFSDLEHSARSQINLLRCIKTAQHPEKLQLLTAATAQPESIPMEQP